MTVSDIRRFSAGTRFEFYRGGKIETGTVFLRRGTLWVKHRNGVLALSLLAADLELQADPKVRVLRAGRVVRQ